jgi:uncharacterized protein (TIGR03067 family)
MRRSLLLLTTALGMAFAPAPPDRNKEDLKKLQGRWVSVQRVYRGAKKVETFPVTLVIRGRLLTVIVNGEKDEEFKFTLDAGRKPKAIDLQEVKRPVWVRAVYELERDHFTLSIGEDESKRPASLTAAEDRIVFKRVNPPRTR